MSAPRARANHSLYLAKILLGAWQREIGAQDIPTRTLNEAFLPATRDHLCAAYGWFLLEVTQLDDTATAPPRCAADLPAIPEGRAEAGELRECRRLEQGGWLAALLADPGLSLAGSAPTAGNLAVGAPDAPGLAELAQWHDALSALFARMRDSLDEY